MIRNIIFDFGKVLVDYNFHNFLRSIFDTDEEAEKFHSLVCSEAFVARCDKGDETFPEIIRRTQEQHPEWRAQLDEFRDRQMDALVGEVPGMREMLTQLRSRGFRLFGLTNWSAEVYQVMEKYDILQMLEGTVVSSDEHIIKPDAAIYRILCDRFSLVPDECLFIDDRQTNVDGAIKAGLHAIRFTDAASLASSLATVLPPFPL